jgi:hypothetical protein
MADISSGMVMKGPTPIMLDMFSAVDCNSPNRRSSVGPSGEEVDIRPPILLAGGHLPLRDSRDVPIMLTMVSASCPWACCWPSSVAGGTRPRAGHRAEAAAGRRLAALLAETAGFDPALLRTAVAYASEHETKRPRDYSDQVHLRPSARAAAGRTWRHERPDSAARMPGG